MCGVHASALVWGATHTQRGRAHPEVVGTGVHNMLLIWCDVRRIKRCTAQTQRGRAHPEVVGAGEAADDEWPAVGQHHARRACGGGRGGV